MGRAAALGLLRAGFHVVLAGRRQGLLEEVAELGASTGRQSLVVPTDVADPASVERLFERTRETFGRVDLLFNNAGVFGTSAPIEELSVDQWNTVVEREPHGCPSCARERRFC